VLVQQVGIGSESKVDEKLLDLVKLSCVRLPLFLGWDDDEKQDRSPLRIFDKELLIAAELVVSKDLLPEIIRC
jgi:hypothetical protein